MKMKVWKWESAIYASVVKYLAVNKEINFERNLSLMIEQMLRSWRERNAATRAIRFTFAMRESRKIQVAYEEGIWRGDGKMLISKKRCVGLFLAHRVQRSDNGGVAGLI
jgi:hypothetical protein